MAKIKHLLSETAGHVPSGLIRGQVAINIPDKLVYANDPSGTPSVISSGNSGVANATGFLGVHIPNNFMPVAQLGPGLTPAQTQALFTDDGTTATYNNIPVFALGKLWWTGVVTCPSSAAGSYSINIDTVNRTASLAAFAPAISSGIVNYTTGVIQLVVHSNSTTYPWFYVPTISSSGGASLLRISPIQTFGAIPVSAGFAGAAATSYWGAPA